MDWTDVLEIAYMFLAFAAVFNVYKGHAKKATYIMALCCLLALIDLTRVILTTR